MKASLEALDRWAKWMEEETLYARTKFTTRMQLGYFEQGVDRGDYSISTSSVNRLLGAARRQAVDGDVLTKLRIVQEVGKSAQNHLACAAIAKVSRGQFDDFMPAYFDVRADWYGALKTGELTDFVVDEELARRQFKLFSDLQTIQDVGTHEEFDGALKEMALPIHVGFISLAGRYGWPKPGVSSSEDHQRWENN